MSNMAYTGSLSGGVAVMRLEKALLEKTACHIESVLDRESRFMKFLDEACAHSGKSLEARKLKTQNRLDINNLSVERAYELFQEEMKEKEEEGLEESEEEAHPLDMRQGPIIDFMGDKRVHNALRLYVEKMADGKNTPTPNGFAASYRGNQSFDMNPFREKREKESGIQQETEFANRLFQNAYDQLLHKTKLTKVTPKHAPHNTLARMAMELQRGKTIAEKDALHQMEENIRKKQSGITNTIFPISTFCI